MSHNNLSILSHANKQDIQNEPYPYIVIKNALDINIFEQLQKEYPNIDVIINHREKKDTWYDYPTCLALHNPQVSPLWKEFLAYHTSNAFYQEIVDLFDIELRKTYPEIKTILGKEWGDLTTSMRLPGAASNKQNYETDLSLETQFYVNFTQKVRTIRGPHIDRPTELYAALLYFREENDDSIGGDLQVNSAKQPIALYPNANSVKVDCLPMEISDDKVDVVNTIKYEPNTMVLFLNTNKSIHAVSQRSPTIIPRKHINFTADIFNLPNEGLFNIKHKPSKKLKKWLQRQPIIWRCASLIND